MVNERSTTVPCMRSLWFMVISIYMVIIQSCIPAYIGITRWQWDRKRRKMIEENEFKAGRDLSWLQMTVSSRSPLTHLCVFSILLLFSILFHYFDHGFALPRWTRRIHFADDRAADINNYSLWNSRAPLLYFLLFSSLFPFLSNLFSLLFVI